MKLPLQISFHNLDRSEKVEDRIREEAARLDAFCDHIMSCRVVVDVPHRRHVTGNVYQVRIDIKVPGEEIAVRHEPAAHDPYYENVNVAIRDAFNSAARRLEDYVRRQRKDVKHHEVDPHGRVSKLEAGFGFIETPDGREVYFHGNSLLGASSTIWRSVRKSASWKRWERRARKPARCECSAVTTTWLDDSPEPAGEASEQASRFVHVRRRFAPQARFPPPPSLCVFPTPATFLGQLLGCSIHPSAQKVCPVRPLSHGRQLPKSK